MHKSSYEIETCRMRKQQAQGLELNGKFLIFLLYTFCFAFFSFEFSRNVLLTNLENHELQKAYHWDKKICLEALFFFSPFGRENQRELEGIPGWRPEVAKYDSTFQLQVSLGSRRKVSCVDLFASSFPSHLGEAEPVSVPGVLLLSSLSLSPCVSLVGAHRRVPTL